MTLVVLGVSAIVGHYESEARARRAAAYNAAQDRVLELLAQETAVAQLRRTKALAEAARLNEEQLRRQAAEAAQRATAQANRRSQAPTPPAPHPHPDRGASALVFPPLPQAPQPPAMVARGPVAASAPVATAGVAPRVGEVALLGVR